MQYADDVPIHVFFAIDANPLHSPDPVNGSIVFASHTHRLVPPPPCLASNSPPVDANRLARVAAASLAETTTRPHPGGVTRDINTTRNDVVSELQSSLRSHAFASTRSRPSCPARTRPPPSSSRTRSPPPRPHRERPPSRLPAREERDGVTVERGRASTDDERRARARERVRLEIEQRAAS